MITVAANGCFDILHYGHMAHLRAARALGDRLVVILTGDDFVNKGPGRPVFNERHRKEQLLELRSVDDVVISYEPTPYALIRHLRPQIYAKGKEYEGRLPEQKLIESYGAKVVFTDTVVFSSTKLLGWL